LRRYWGIYRQSFVQKEAEMGPNLRGNQILFRVYYDSCRNRKLLEVEDALVGPSCQRKKSSNAACALLVLLLLVAGTAACACAQPRWLGLLVGSLFFYSFVNCCISFRSLSDANKLRNFCKYLVLRTIFGHYGALFQSNKTHIHI
jgi:hypothetical protein